MHTDVIISTLSPVFDHHYTGKIVFRNMSRADGFPFFTATRDPAFNRFLLWSAPEEEAQIFLQVDKLIRQNTLKAMIVQSICKKTTGEWLGYLICKPFRDGVEIGLALHPVVWNTGVVFTVGSTVIEMIVRTLSGVPIYSRVTPANKKMHRVCQSYGFEKIGEATEDHATTGAPMHFDVCVLNMDKWNPFENVQQY